MTGNTARTALLCTAGHPDVLLFREGGGRTTLFDYAQEYPAPYVPRSLTFEIPERILRRRRRCARRSTKTPSLEVAESLRRLEVEAIAVCLLWSIVNPAHELRVGELLAQAVCRSSRSRSLTP